jgi:ABC-type nitrate/sulfonate/bicarbonate transport system substrate-binding protein
MTAPISRRKPAPVELWYSHRGGATASALAARQGWLQEEFAHGGTILRNLSDAGSRDIRLAHYHHGQSGLLREGGNVPAIWARSQGQNAVVIAITWVDEYQGILVRADSRIHHLGDLQGKRLGLPLRRHAMIDLQRASAQRGFSTALTLAGLEPTMARWTHIQSPDFEYPQRTAGKEVELDALRSGYVDAVFLRGAPGYVASRDPAFRELLDLNTQSAPLLRVNNGTPRPITVDQAFLERHPDIVQRYLAVLVRTARWSATNPSEVSALLVEESPGFTAEQIACTHGPQLHRSLMPSLSTSYVKALEMQKNFLLNWRYIDQDFDVQQWIDAAPLTAVLQASLPRHVPSGAPHAARWNAVGT